MFLAFVIVSLLFYAPGTNFNPTEISIFWLLLVVQLLSLSSTPLMMSSGSNHAPN